MKIKRETIEESVLPRTHITYSDLWGEIKDVIKVLKRAENEIMEQHPEATGVFFKISSSGYDEEDIDIEFKIARPESDLELNHRIKLQKQREASSKRLKLLHEKKKKEKLQKLSLMTKEEILKHLAGKK